MLIIKNEIFRPNGEFFCKIELIENQSRPMVLRFSDRFDLPNYLVDNYEMALAVAKECNEWLLSSIIRRCCYEN